MNKAEFKKLLKPIVKECIQESLLEGGVLSKVISEVVRGINVQQTIVEEKQQNNRLEEEFAREEENNYVQKLNETKRKMLDAIGNNNYNGVNLFENTEPISSAPSPGESVSPNSPLSGVSPNDAGVDIGALMGGAGRRWNTLAKGNK